MRVDFKNRTIIIGNKAILLGKVGYDQDRSRLWAYVDDYAKWRQGNYGCGRFLMTHRTLGWCGMWGKQYFGDHRDIFFDGDMWIHIRRNLDASLGETIPIDSSMKAFIWGFNWHRLQKNRPNG